MSTEALATTLPAQINFSSIYPALEWPGLAGRTVLQAQLLQIEMISAWQKGYFEANKELWDQWIARFGGGVPIDG